MANCLHSFLKYSEYRHSSAIDYREGKRSGMNYEEFKRLYEVSEVDYDNIRKLGVRIAPAIEIVAPSASTIS